MGTTYFKIPVGPYSCYSQSGTLKRCEEEPTILNSKQVIFEPTNKMKITCYSYSSLSSDLPVYPVTDISGKYQYYTYISGYFTYSNVFNQYENLHAYCYTDYKGVVCVKEGVWTTKSIKVNVIGYYSNLSLSGFTTRYSATMNLGGNTLPKDLVVYFTSNFMVSNMHGYLHGSFTEKNYIYYSTKDAIDGKTSTPVYNISSYWDGTSSEMISGTPKVESGICTMDSFKPSDLENGVSFVGLISYYDLT